LDDFFYDQQTARDSLLHAKGYRKLVIDNYIILYSVDKKNDCPYNACVLWTS